MKKGSPRVSIITIFLNAGSYLEEAIGSVLAQSFTDWELLLVDDGSTDQSSRLAGDYARAHPGRITVLEHEARQNRGMPASRDLGLAHSRGELIALLDADDVWLPDRLAAHVSVFDSQDRVGMVYGPSRYWHSWSTAAARQDFTQRLGVEPNRLIEPPELLLDFLSGKAPTPCPSAVLLRRAAVEQVGGFAREMTGFYQVYEDQAFFFKLCLQWPVFVLDRQLDLYRRHPDSCYSQARSSGKKHLARQHYLEFALEHLHGLGFRAPEVDRELRRQLWKCRHPRLWELHRKPRRLLRKAGHFLGGLRKQ